MRWTRLILSATGLRFGLLVGMAFQLEIPAEGNGGDVSRPSLTIRVTGVEGGSGQIAIALFATEETWLKEAWRTETVKAVDGIAEWVIADCPAGAYAASVFHDVNENGELDTGFMYIPKEPYGFSNDAKARFGPAKWEDAKVTVGDEDLAVEIQLQGSPKP